MGKKDKNDSVEDEVSPKAFIADVERLARLMRQASHAHGLVPVQWEILRYLARANQFSRTPGAIGRYLGTTKGTISQTIHTLEKRGMVEKARNTGDSRSVSLSLTPAALEVLRHDPLNALIAEASELGSKTTRRAARAIAQLLAMETGRVGEPRFGTCMDCMHLQIEADEKLRCKIFEIEIEVTDLEQLCARYALKPA